MKFEKNAMEKSLKIMDKKKKNKRTNNDLQNTTQKTNDRATINPRKIMGGICYVTLVTNLVTSHKGGKDQIVIMTSRIYPWSFVIQVFRNG
jgi:hypothetical protein